MRNNDDDDTIMPRPGVTYNFLIISFQISQKQYGIFMTEKTLYCTQNKTQFFLQKMSSTITTVSIINSDIFKTT